MTPPIKNFSLLEYPQGSITQYFGENIPLYASLNIGLNNGHNGLDIVAPWGTPILAMTKQRVVEVKNSPNGYGKHVRCVDEDYEYTYGHLSSIDCIIGQELEEGEEFAKMGNTGFVVSGATPFWKMNPYAGTHLHLTLRRKAKPKETQWMTQYSTGETFPIADWDNGHKGAIDPALLLEDKKEVVKLQLTLLSLLNQISSLLGKIINIKKNNLQK